MKSDDVSDSGSGGVNNNSTGSNVNSGSGDEKIREMNGNDKKDVFKIYNRGKHREIPFNVLTYMVSIEEVKLCKSMCVCVCVCVCET